MTASHPGNPTCQFPACLDGSCTRACAKVEKREFATGRAAVRTLAKEALEQAKRLESEMDA